MMRRSRHRCRDPSTLSSMSRRRVTMMPQCADDHHTIDENDHDTPPPPSKEILLQQQQHMWLLRYELNRDDDHPFYYYHHHHPLYDDGENENDGGLFDTLILLVRDCLLWCGCGIVAFLTYHWWLYPSFITHHIQHETHVYPIHLDYSHQQYTNAGGTTTTASSLSLTAVPNELVRIVPSATIFLPSISSSASFASQQRHQQHHDYHTNSKYYYIQIQLELPDTHHNRYVSSMFTIKYQLVHTKLAHDTDNDDDDDAGITDEAKHRDHKVSHLRANLSMVVPATNTPNDAEQQPGENRIDESARDHHHLSFSRGNHHLPIIASDHPSLSPMTTRPNATRSLGLKQPQHFIHHNVDSHRSSCSSDIHFRPIPSDIMKKDHVDDEPTPWTPNSTTALPSASFTCGESNECDSDDQTEGSSTTFRHTTTDAAAAAAVADTTATTTNPPSPSTPVVLDTIIRSYRYPYRSPLVTGMMNVLSLLPHLVWQRPSFTTTNTNRHDKQIWESQIITDTIVQKYNVSQQPTYPLNTILLQVIQHPPSGMVLSSSDHHPHLVEIIGGTVIIGPEYTPLQQFMMVDFYYSCTTTITILIGSLYFSIIYYCFVIPRRRRRRRRRQRSNYTASYNKSNMPPQFHRTNDGHTTSDHIDDLHNFDYMNDLHVDDDYDEVYSSEENKDEWIPLYGNNDSSDSAVPTNHIKNSISQQECNRNQLNPTAYNVADENDCFFDAMPFPPDNQENDVVTDPTRIDNDNNASTAEECLATTFTVTNNMTTLLSLPLENSPSITRADTLLSSRHHSELLQPLQSQQVVPDVVTTLNPSTVISIDNAPSIQLLTTTISNHSTMETTGIVASSSMARSTSDDAPSFQNSSSNVSRVDDSNHGTKNNDTNMSGRATPTTPVTDGIQVLQLLWTELQNRSRQSDTTNDSNEFHQLRIENSDHGMYQNHPFLVFLS